MGNKSCRGAPAGLPERVGQIMQDEGMKARIAKGYFKPAAGGRVFIQDVFEAFSPVTQGLQSLLTTLSPAIYPFKICLSGGYIKGNGLKLITSYHACEIVGIPAEIA